MYLLFCVFLALTSIFYDKFFFFGKWASFMILCNIGEEKVIWMKRNVKEGTRSSSCDLYSFILFLLLFFYVLLKEEYV